MHNKWIIFLAAVWILGLLIGGITEKVYFCGTDMTVLEAFFTFRVLDLSWYSEWLGVLQRMFTFDYGIFTSTWWGQIVRYFFIATGIGIAVQLGLDIVRIIRGA